MKDQNKSKTQLIVELEEMRRRVSELEQSKTGNKQAEEALRKSEEQLRLITENTTDNIAITTFDLKATYIYVNPSVKSVLGYDPEELLGKSFFDFIHPDDKKVLFPLLKKYVKLKIKKLISGKEIAISETIEFRFKNKIGNWRFMQSTVNIAGKQLLAVTRDITERKQAEEALKESEERFRRLFKDLGDAVFVTKIDGTNRGQIIEVNPAAEEQTGYTKSELIGMNISKDLAIPESGEISHAEWDKRLSRGKSVTTTEMKRRKDGTQYWVEVVVTPIEYKGTKACLSINRDITERKQAEEEKAKLEQQLRRAQKLETIGTLAGGIAHDFNNILAPIMGYTDMALLNLEETHPLYNDLEHILKGAYRAKELVEQILLFSKQAEKERHPLALQSLVKEALKLLRPSIPTTIEIRQRIDDSCGKVRADATQIHQVIVNLCTNAWQAMKENGGTLTIELNQKKVDAVTAKLHPNLNEAEYACLSIIDTGPGMDDETLDRIFEPFFTTKAVDKGTGLGLSVVHGIVYSHKGDILVYSEQGKGSAFHVYLPTLKSEEKIVETKSKEITGGSEYVMIVDDEPTIAEMVKSMLEKFGYKADVYKTGLAALKAFKQQPDKYDLLLSDLTMPQITGLDLADQLHKECPELPVVIMTGFHDKLTAATLKKYGIKQVIGKPIVVKELAATVRKVLDK